MTDTVTEAVEAGLAAIRETMDGTCLSMEDNGSCDQGALCQCRREVRAVVEAALPLIVAGERGFTPTHRHRKGGEYRVVRRGRLEWNLEPAVIYEAKDGTVWVRPEAEFDDGRFAAIRADKGRE